MTTYTILEADGIYQDDVLEQHIFNENASHAYKVNFHRGTLAPPGGEVMHPWTDIPQDIREQVDGIMMLKVYLTAEDMALFPKLKVIVRTGVGYDRIDRKAAAARGIIVANLPDYGTEEIADHATALALSMRRGLLLHHDLQRGPSPEAWRHIPHPLVARLRDSTFGIFGLGRIGTAVALRAKAFGFRVVFYDPHLLNGADKAIGVERVKTMQELFKRADVLSIHCPNTAITQGLIGYDLLSLMKPGSVLVNTARGEIVDLDGVERALKENILAGAGIDVLPEEPIPDPAHSLIQAYRNKEDWLTGRMILTCHSAFFSPASVAEIRAKGAQTMRDVLIDRLNVNIISPDMY